MESLSNIYKVFQNKTAKNLILYRNLYSQSVILTYLFHSKFVVDNHQIVKCIPPKNLFLYTNPFLAKGLPYPPKIPPTPSHKLEVILIGAARLLTLKASKSLLIMYNTDFKHGFLYYKNMI
jgi:hypothetical protein